MNADFISLLQYLYIFKTLIYINIIYIIIYYFSFARLIIYTSAKYNYMDYIDNNTIIFSR